MLPLARTLTGLALVTALAAALPAPAPTVDDPVPVNVDNFERVESDLYFQRFVDGGAFGKWVHAREPVAIDKQDVVRMNRDTLYSEVVVDLDAAPATVVLPDSGDRYMALQVIDEDHYTTTVEYAPGEFTFTREGVGTRYVLFLVRTMVDPNDPADLQAVHALQDAIEVRQAQTGSFEVPAWDTEAAARIRKALNELAVANGGLDSARMFGKRGEVDPVQHLLGTATGWGGNPREAATYVGFVPDHNDGKQAYEVTVRDVPVDGFWSVTVYNAQGFMEPNDLGRYSLNSVTAERAANGSVTIRFGDCGTDDPNCIPTPPGWGYVVRLYRPRKAILDGTWTFPEATPVD